MLTLPGYEQRGHVRPRRVGLSIFIAGWLTLSAVAAPRVLDLVTFTPPPGWNIEEKGSDLTQQVVLSRATTTHYCMIAICASTPASGDLDASFAAEWKSVALQTIDAAPAPKPQSRTIGDARAAAGALNATIQRQPVRAELLVLDAGANVVSILVLTPTAAAFEAYNEEVQTFFAGIKVRPVAAPAATAVTADSGRPLVIPPPPRALAIADLAGEWGRNDGINTTYVDRYSGTYAGTDSLHFTEQWVITAAGEISLDFFAIRNGKKITEKSTGVATLSAAGILTIKMTNEQKYVLRGWLVAPNMTVMNLNGPWYERIPPEILSNPEQGWNLDKKWVRLVKKK